MVGEVENKEVAPWGCREAKGEDGVVGAALIRGRGGGNKSSVGVSTAYGR